MLPEECGPSPDVQLSLWSLCRELAFCLLSNTSVYCSLYLSITCVSTTQIKKEENGSGVVDPVVHNVTFPCNFVVVIDGLLGIFLLNPLGMKEEAQFWCLFLVF